MIRTGDGDEGDTRLGSRLFRKAHSLVQYSASLDSTQSLTTALPVSWGNFQPRDILQQLLFVLGAVLGSKRPQDHELALQEISILMENQLEYIVGSLVPLNKFLRVIEATANLNVLRTKLRETECWCVLAHDALELESKELNENMIYMLKQSMKALNIASDWIFAFIWVYSVDELGKVDKALNFEPWTEDKIKSLNV